MCELVPSLSVDGTNENEKNKEWGNFIPFFQHCRIFISHHAREHCGKLAVGGNIDFPCKCCATVTRNLGCTDKRL